MRKIALIFLGLIAITSYSQTNLWQGPSVNFSHGNLKVSDNKRFLQFTDGTPFFYLGETAWELFHRLTKEEAELFIENRRSKGFTVIQAVVLAELDGLNIPNMEGEKPLIDNDPLKPNEKYFAHVDWVIKKAAEKGIFIGLLPTWGDKIDKQWGTGPVIFNKENAYKYGQWIAKRYKDYPNIIWINGGDRPSEGSNLEIWNALGNGINLIDTNHLISFHPMGGGSSSTSFHNAEWLDFNMSQTGHCDRSYAIIKRLLVEDYNKTPIKPLLNAEPPYEDHPMCWNPDVLGWYNDADVRTSAYWSLFSGALGHTYGCHAIWQMLDTGRVPIGYGRNDWRKDMNLPGAFDITHVRRLIESRPFFSRVPAQDLLSESFYSPEIDYVIATKGEGYAFIYIPSGWEPEIKLEKLGFTNVKAWWFDPREGTAKNFENFEAISIRKFTPPTKGRGNDWVLVLDDASKNFNEPGK